MSEEKKVIKVVILEPFVTSKQAYKRGDVTTVSKLDADAFARRGFAAYEDDPAAETAANESKAGEEDAAKKKAEEEAAAKKGAKK